jgi:serine/threonine protein kinase
MTEPLVGGRYRLGQRIGVGGMGRVWLARDEVLRREVAIKEVLLPETPSEDEAHELRLRTLREARAAARLAHPNVVRVYDVMYADDRPWIVMEYVPSRSLAQVIKADGPMRPEEAALVGIAVLDALCAAHAAGVLHRDIKPGNVLLAEDGRVVLTDFGLATFDEIGTALTQSGIVHGSPQFIAPERALDGTSTAEADMWSLGATLFAAVEGQSPYARSTSYQTLAALATSPPDSPKRAGALKPVLAGLLRRKPSSRMKPDEVRRRLQRVANGESGRARFVPRQRQQNPEVPSEGVRIPPNQAGLSDLAATAGTGSPSTSAPGTPGRVTAATPSNATVTDGATPRAADQDANGDPVSDIAAGDPAAIEAAADEAYRRAATPIEWRNADGGIVVSSSVTKEELESPPGRWRRRWVAAVSAIIVLAAGGGYLAERHLMNSPTTDHQTLPTTGPTAPGSNAPSGPQIASAVPVLGNVDWPCVQQRPANATALPISPTPHNGVSVAPLTWFFFAQDFPVAVPGWLIVRSASTACLYDVTAGRAVGIRRWTPTGTAALDAKAAMRVYQASVSNLNHVTFGPITSASDIGGRSTSARMDFTFLGQSGLTMRTFARVYLIGHTANLISLTTFEANPDADHQVFGLMEASVGIGQRPAATK